ncbi:MAG TPA: lamin tail domain-containing protein, partial [Methylomirabilota bacterium]|nr:lamin tail domain-containing protein [Methylomirabilota bacterium]
MKHLYRLVLPSFGIALTLFQASAAIVINELHYNPDVKTDPAEFVELHNSGTNAVNLAGWYFSDGLNYTFPSTNLAPGKFAVVAQNPTFLQTKYAVTGALGPFNTNGSSGLSSRGERLTLRDAAGQVQDEVEFQLGFPWPTVGDAVTPGNGNSIELIHPNLDNDLGGSWRSSLRVGGANGPTPGRTNTVFATNAPPQTRQVEHAPNEPTSGQSVRITARVTDPHGVASVTLQYQIVSPGAYIELADAAFTNAANWITLPMNDSGTGGDVTPGDETFTAQIPAAVQTHRRLIRYRITVADAFGSSVRVPYADDPQPNFAYFVYDGVPGWQGAVQPGAGGANGTVLNYSSNVMGRLPVYHLIARSNTAATATWFSRYTGDLYQWGGTLVYDGKVYDHIRYRARGGVWRYSMVKNMWKFDMNRGHDFEPRDNWGRKFNTPWTKVNLGASIQQGDFNHRGEQGMFESVGFRLFQLAGVPAPNTAFVTFRLIDDAQEASPGTQFEGDYWGAYLAIEQEDGRFLEEHGLPDGNLYKMEGGTGELNNTGPNGPINKADLTYLQANYTGASEQWWRTNWNLASHYSYQAIVQGIHHYDIADGKNYFFYRNPETRLWESCTWDLDLTWANNMYRAGQTGGDEPLKSRLLDNFASPGRLPAVNIEFRNRVREIRDLLWNSDQAFKLIDEYAALLRGPTNGPTILDADRSMWDYNPKMLSSTYTPNLGKAGQGRYYQWPEEPTVSKNFDGGLQALKNYVGYRSTNAVFSLDTMAADNAKPVRPTIAYTGPAGFPINRLTFRSTNYSGANPFKSIRWRIAEITDTNSPNYNPNEPHKYEIETVWDSGPITSFNADMTIPANVLRGGSRYRVRVLHTDTTGRNSQWSLQQEFAVGPPANEADLLNYLRITEFMFNPPPGGYEYVELYNSSASITLDLSGVKFTQGIDYTFLQGTTLAPGAYLVLVGTPDIAGFRTYYGLNPSVTVVGPYTGALNNAGEQLVLRTSAGGSDIVNFSFGDGRGWPPQSDGAGHAVVLLDSAIGAQGNGAGEYAGNWRASAYLRGSPGAPDAVLPASIVLNEIVAHTDYTNDLASNDWIEIYNPSDAVFVFGPGWYLSDDGANPAKWQIPVTSFIQPRGFITFDEVTGFHNPTNLGFGLNKDGEQVFLSFFPGGAQNRIVDAVSFKGQENDWSVGRYPDGGPFWYALTPRTRDTTNAAPPARVVISEVMFHPPDVFVGTNLSDNSLDEFVEIHNATPEPVALHNTNGTWRFTGGVDFVFPTNVTLAADGYLLVVNFNPVTNAAQLAAFKSAYGITNPDLLILGPYSGKLANNSDRLALEKPQHPDGTNTVVSWVIIDEVLYADQSPWPCGSDGSGNSLQRLDNLS